MKLSRINTDELMNLVESNIATPYIKINTHGKYPIEYGYCLVKESNEILEKNMINCDYRDIIIDNDSVKIHMNITTDGYIRFWIDDIKFYIMWNIDAEDKRITLKVYRRKT